MKLECPSCKGELYVELPRNGHFISLSISPWQPIETAPKDGTLVDLVVKTWNNKTDLFEHERYTRCYWNDIGWSGFLRGGRAIYWMPIPELPKV